MTAPLDATWVDWRFERYTDQVVNVQVVDRGGYPVNITGWSLRWTAGSYLSKAVGSGITITAPLTGNFTFTITKSESLLFPYGDLGDAVEHQCKGQEPGAGTPVHLVFRGRLRYTGTLITTV